ncbi:tol-pal system-associated acyl-CoA thioesterase [Pseudothauera nasutitermitis]|uniref:Tol-pal system-associated acyl-CoA thioesterase n=1 Tax=Pseudothauera nasutitermitis TaxID=2565930 RepID=A0A4V3WBE0_9RHOO|nr:tol-pal system-associated acyl-CoA thioesterase [Pseudothauera nasutitermitis]THF62889.1 tol-pal system-associated acyl-CoA thioesterase [Pseudothauera nasutitermitis]
MQNSSQSRSAASAPDFPWALRVYYEDTDAAGMVYYANYLRFCERARTEWLRAAGFSQQRMAAEQGLAFVVRSFQAEYRRPAVLDDSLLVLTRIERLGRASIEFAQRIVRGDELLFEASVSVACIGTTHHKPTALPAEVRAQLSAHVAA